MPDPLTPPQVIVAPAPALQASGSDALVMAAYTLATTVATEMRMHREECKQRDERGAVMFKEIRESSTKIDDNMEKIKDENNKKHNENVEKMNSIAATNQQETAALSSKVSWIMGGIGTASFLFNAAVAVAVMFYHH